MTNHWVDIKNADLVLIMGGNAAEAHPCGFKWVTEAKAKRGAKLVVVDPRFTRSAAVSDYYAPIRVGADIAFLGGVIALYAFGIPGMALMLDKTLAEATLLITPYLPGDAIKVVLAALVTQGIARMRPGVLLSRG